ncbi:ABC transporter substrate-binding protein [Kineococcus sp. SYSU DK001]|uniref:ABC transporter substrate-binding protein n=1 Tax=Kineococcus sp. SYSU DK001 TaxID=3383122 RepID=UPI003D7E4595
MRRLTPALVLLLLTACGGSGTGAEGTAPGAGYPLTVRNCGADVTFDAEPERVVLLKSAAVPFLHDLGVLDRVVARAGRFPADYYDEATRAELDAIPSLTDRLDTSGHLQISREVVIAQRPDLVIGEVDNLDRATLEAAGIPLLEEPALCGSGVPDVGFDDVSEQMEFYGAVFDRRERAAAAAAELRERVADLTVPATGRTAAVLYPTVGGGVTYAYGSASMANPQLEAAGFTNVFADVDDRVFEVTREELIARDPDVLVLLHSDGDPQAVTEAVTSMPGLAGVTAVRDGAVLPLLFNFTEPPTPLAVEGLARIVERFPPVGAVS